MWDNEYLPTARYILKPDSSDSTWNSFKIQGIKESIKNFDSSINNVTDSLVLEFLKEFDKKIPKNVSLNDSALDNAWKKWFEGDNYGLSFQDIRVCFGSTNSAIKYASVVLDVRLKNFDLSSTAPETEQSGPSNPTEPPLVDEEVEDLFSQRLQSLEQFLQASGTSSSIGTNAANFLLGLATRNGYDYSLEQTSDRFRSFAQIIAPITKIGELDDTYQKSLFDKIEASGLYDLVIHIDAMQAYGRARLSTLERVKGSAGSANVLME